MTLDDRKIVYAMARDCPFFAIVGFNTAYLSLIPCAPRWLFSITAVATIGMRAAP